MLYLLLICASEFVVLIYFYNNKIYFIKTKTTNFICTPIFIQIEYKSVHITQSYG
jgi:hypothetical protein